MSARRLSVLVRELKADSSLSRALNDGQLPWTNTDHRIADLWWLWRNQDHPVRAEMEANTHIANKQSRFGELKTKFEKRKRRYGLG